MSLSNSDIDLLVMFRHDLHQHPELSGMESETMLRISDFLRKHTDASVHTHVGGTGVLAVFDSGKSGPVIGVRADHDALSISEDSGVSYTSRNTGVAHSCGHDGHTAILCGLAIRFTKNPIKFGKLVLIFQPAEETGKGASAIINDPSFSDIGFDSVIGLHNIPGTPLGKVLIREGTMCAASIGMQISFEGISSHSAYPENGRSPVVVLGEVLPALDNIVNSFISSGSFLRTTIAGINIGSDSYGISPGKGKAWLTIRTLDNPTLDLAISEIRSMIESKANDYGISTSVELFEHFEATMNDTQSVRDFVGMLSEHNIQYTIENDPFYWSEDFGRFTTHFDGFFFGLGAGEDCHPLHHQSYDFPDKLIPHGVNVFEQWVRHFTNKQP